MLAFFIDIRLLTSTGEQFGDFSSDNVKILGKIHSMKSYSTIIVIQSSKTKKLLS